MGQPGSGWFAGRAQHFSPSVMTDPNLGTRLDPPPPDATPNAQRPTLAPASYNPMDASLAGGYATRSPAKHPGTSASTQSATMTTPGHTPETIQSHLYDAFLSGGTADIGLRIRGDGWDRGYMLHRIVLTQAVSTVHGHARS